MTRACLRLAEEAEGDPARHELRLEPLVVGGGRVAFHDGVGGLVILDVEKVASDAPPLAPPLVAVRQDGGVARHVGQRLCGLSGLRALPEVLRERELVRAVLSQARGHGVEQLLRGHSFRVDGDARLHQRIIALSGELGRAPCPVPVLLEQQALHPGPMVGGRQNGRKFLKDLGFELAPEHVAPPGLPDEGGRLSRQVLRPERQR
jgi:hypothetical protein